MSTKKSRYGVLTGIGVAAGAVLAAAMIPVATAPTARADLDDDFGVVLVGLPADTAGEPDLMTDETNDLTLLTNVFQAVGTHIQSVTQAGLTAAAADLGAGNVGGALNAVTNVIEGDGLFAGAAFYDTTVIVPDMVLWSPLSDLFSYIP